MVNPLFHHTHSLFDLQSVVPCQVRSHIDSELGVSTGTVHQYKTGFSCWTGPEKLDLKKISVILLGRFENEQIIPAVIHVFRGLRVQENNMSEVEESS